MAHSWTAKASALAVLLALAVWSGAGCAARRPAALPPPAPEALDRWERILALAPGSRVRVELQSGAVVEGRLQAANLEHRHLPATSQPAIRTLPGRALCAGRHGACACLCERCRFRPIRRSVGAPAWELRACALPASSRPPPAASAAD